MRLLILIFFLLTLTSSVIEVESILNLRRKRTKDPTSLISGGSPLVDVVNRVKVARRNLGPMPLSVNILAHSALLLETTNAKKYILEYMSDSRVYLVEIHPSHIWLHTPQHGTDRFEAKGAKGNYHFETFEWIVQHHGVNVDPQKMITPQDFKNTMMAVVSRRGNYHVLSNNCHMAQENTRKTYGIFR